MQGQSSVIDIIKSIVEKSLTEPIPQSIDDCISGFRYIIEFSGKDDEVVLQTAEILDSDWVLIDDASIQLRNKIKQIVEYRNIEFRQAIKQERDIREDQKF